MTEALPIGPTGPIPDPPPKRKKRRRRLPLVVWPEHWQRLIQAAASLRDRAFIAIGLYAGLRVSEIAALDVADVDLAGQMLHVRAGKGDKEAWQPLAAKGIPHLEAWILEREGLFLPEVQALFPSGRGNGRLTVRAWFNAVREAGSRAGLGEEIHPHTLRHSYATGLLEAKVPIEEVMVMMRHEDIRSTIIYTHIRRDKRRAAADKL